MADDHLDALLQLAEEADDAANHATASEPAPGGAAAGGPSTTADDDDPLLGLADAICTTDAAKTAETASSSRHITDTMSRPAARPALCSTRAFSTATPGSSRNSSISRPGPGPGNSSSSTLPRQQQEVQHYVEKLTGLKIKLPRVSGVVLKERYRAVTCVPVSKAQQHMASDGSSWVVIGVLVSKQIGTTSKGAPYSRWRVSDLGGSDAQVALFGEAHKDHYAEAEGSVLAFYSPRFSNKGPGGSSSSSSGGLAVSQAAQIELLATSAGWGFCRGTTKTGARCSNAVDTTVSHFCQYHALQQAKTLRAPVKGHTKQQQQLPEPITQPAASNGKVFDARSKTWGTASRPQPQAAAAAAAGGSGGGLGGSKHLGSMRGSGAGGGSGGGFGSRSTSSGYHILNSCSGGSSGGKVAVAGGSRGGVGATDSRAKAATAAMQADLRESLKAKLQQQQQQQPGSRCGGIDSTAAAGRRPVAGSGFNLLSVMDAVSRGAEQDEPQQQQQQQQQQLPLSARQPILQQQQQQRNASAEQQRQQRQPKDWQGPPARQQQQQQQQEQQQQEGQHEHQQQVQQQQQQQQEGDGLDDLLDELFEDDDEEAAAADDLVIQPDTAAAAAAAAVPADEDDLVIQPRKPAAAAAAAAAADVDSAAVRGASAMARLSSSSIVSSGGGSTAAKLTDARKRMKVALGMAPKSSLGGGSSSSGGGVKKGAAGGGKAGTSAAGAGSSRVHVSRIGAVGGATVGAAAAAAAGGSMRSSSSSGGVTAAALAAAAAGRAGAAAGTASTAAAAGVGCGPGGVGASKGGAGGAASGFRAMFGRVLQRTDINKPDSKLLGAVGDAAHASMMSKLLDQYEQKDNLAQQLEGITKMEVTAFECRTCKFLTEKRRATCSGHDVVPVRVTKRWWNCEACGWKLHTLRELMPSKRCPKCRDPEKLFRPTSAYNAPKPVLVNADAAANPLACSEAMLPRGKEHAFCLNSLQD